MWSSLFLVSLLVAVGQSVNLNCTAEDYALMSKCTYIQNQYDCIEAPECKWCSVVGFLDNTCVTDVEKKTCTCRQGVQVGCSSMELKCDIPPIEYKKDGILCFTMGMSLNHEECPTLTLSSAAGMAASLAATVAVAALALLF